MKNEGLDTKTILLDGKEYTVELAVTDQSKWQGLSDREELESNGGMLFVWDEEAPRRFSMRRMHFNIDIIFLDKNGSLINMFVDVPPWNSETGTWYFSEGPAQYVLEVRGGSFNTAFINGENLNFIDVASLNLN